MSEENPIQGGGVQSGLAAEASNQCARPWVDIEIGPANGEPDPAGGPELLRHHKSSTCGAQEFDERHVT